MIGGISARFREQLAEKEASDRGFGLLLGAAFFGLSILRFWKTWRIPWWAAAFGALLILIALASPAILRRPKRAWLFLGFLLGLVVNPIVLAVLFYGVVTPAGLLGRIFGRDSLGLRRNSGATYWRDRTEAASDMKLQF